tara:strand:- start:1861 stop:2343 length:483 start_codon:yes stop_codon:yes gene_type:complete
MNTGTFSSNSKLLKLMFLAVILFVTKIGIAQDLNPISWQVACTKIGDVNQLEFTASIEEGWYLYSQEIDEGGPIPTSFKLSYDGKKFKSINPKEISTNKLVSMDEMFLMELTKYKNDVRYTYPLDEAMTNGTIRASVEFMCCDDTQCLAPKTVELTLNLK